MLTENAFAVLDAMPGDNRRVLNDKADEAALLGGDNTDAALTQLMQMNRRIAAEVRWLPGATAEAASSFLAYSRAIADGQRAAIPPLDGLGTALAQANALAPFFEQWPTDERTLFIGLCRALDSILSQVMLEDTLEAINADRTSGGWEPIPDLTALTAPLDEHLRELCAPARRAMEGMAQPDAAKALTAFLGAPGIDSQGFVAQALCDAYRMKIHEEAEMLLSVLQEDIKKLIHAEHADLQKLQAVKPNLERWLALTAPLQRIPGAIRNEMKALGQGLRNAIVQYVNTAGTFEKKKTVTTLTGTATITYHTQRDFVNAALRETRWMQDCFINHSEVMDLLKEDVNQLNGILRNEEKMLANAEQAARALPVRK